jgi:hypothetical protein
MKRPLSLHSVPISTDDVGIGEATYASRFGLPIVVLLALVVALDSE